ncbi:MAG: hypothetical protein IT376_18475 [Polyangiaceae bacterium]|nr:hypothetical protein [Polyangiaceae bacterium]
MRPTEALQAAAGYLKRHPEELVRAARNALDLRFGVPVAALRWLAGQAKGRKAPKDIEIEAVPPGLRASATVDLMGNSVRASAIVVIERVCLTPDELRFEIRLRDVTLEILQAAPDSPVATLLLSGALDLSKPGNLVNFMPKKPPILVEAEGDRIVLDLRKHPKLANARAEKIIGLVTSLVSVRAIESDWDHLELELETLPDGVVEAVYAVRRMTER